MSLRQILKKEDTIMDIKAILKAILEEIFEFVKDIFAKEVPEYADKIA